MAREEVNPDMLLKQEGVPASPGKAVKATGKGREVINPPDDIVKASVPQPGPIGTVAASSGNRGPINPDMRLKQEGASGEPQADERMSPVQPEVGKVPSGMQAAKKVEPGQG